jgi:hypothetical protein
MKNLIKISFLLLFTLSFLGTTQAQKTLTDGSVTYEMKLDESNPAAAMLAGATMEFVFKGDLVKTSINLGMMMSMNIIMDNKSEKGMMLMSIPMMGKNIAVEMTPEDIKKAKEEQKTNQSKANIEYFKKSKKKIAGYKCYKAVATISGMPDPITLYITDKIKPTGQSQIQSQIPGLTGFPLMYEITAQGMKISFQASEVKNFTPETADFEMSIPDGFEKLTMEELKEMGMGSMGGFGM